tara:strand:+ start:33 stop:497 length:465 start_codon:yes stop_codon:yes gene_type:complete
MALITLGANSGKGKVLQVVRTYVANQQSAVSTTSTSLVGSGIQASITPTKSGNLILIDFNSTMSNNSSNIGRARMYQKIGSGSFAQMSGAAVYHIGYMSSGWNRYAPHCFGGSYTATSTDTLIYEPYIEAPSGGTYQFVHANASYSLTVTEVEQ